MTAYWIAHVTVTVTAQYEQYRNAASTVIPAHGGEFIARGGESVTLEGPELQRHVIIRFPSIAAAKACYDSEAYRAARALRDGAATVHLTIVEGV